MPDAGIRATMRMARRASIIHEAAAEVCMPEDPA